MCQAFNPANNGSVRQEMLLSHFIEKKMESCREVLTHRGPST